MATTGKWTTRSTGKILEDTTGLGRWSGLTFLGKQNKRLTVLTAYRSPRQQPHAGFGFYDQQYALLLSQGVKKPNVRKKFITDITSLINELQTAGHEVLVSLDANETPGQDSSHGIRHLMEECTLTDLHCLGPNSPPATYKYGVDRKIDYMLGTPAVAQCVRRAGFLAYDNGIFSKHRGLFIDLDFTALMGAVDAIITAPSRGLHSENQVSVDRYLEALKKYFADHKIDNRVRDLKTVASSLTTSQCKESYDVIDRDVTRAMLHAEKEAKRPSGKYEWSPKLREAGLLARYWNLRLKELDGGAQMSSVLSRLRQRIHSLHIKLVDDLGESLAHVRAHWKVAMTTLKKVREAAFDYRATHLHSNLEMYQSLKPEGYDNAAENNKKIRRILQLLNTEQMRKPFRAIHYSTSSPRSAGLSKLFVPVGIQNPQVASKYCQPDGSLSQANLIQMAQSDKLSVKYKTILNCEEIEHELLTYNRNWFRQAHETPFGHGELYDMVGYDGLPEEADNIVSGFCIEHMGLSMSRELQVFLEECKRPASVVDIKSSITVDEFKSNVKKWKESTSTSPSGRHLGHYRTAILDDRVASLHTDMLNIPIQYGFAPERWTKSVTPMIEKDEGKPYLTRLRVIHLFEADYNLFLKILFGKRLVRNGERSNALNDQQQGSRPRRMTTDALFLSRLEKDLIRQTKSNSAHMDNDATGCYDRIITSLGMMACRRLGMPSNVIRCQAETLFHMTYAVKHVYGISTAQYKGSPEEPLFGTGQGSGASPAIWLSLVVILLNSLDRMSKEDNIPALTFTDPWQEILAEWRVGAFVDDTNQGIVDPTGGMTSEDLVEQLRKAGQMWERLLHISGGSLNLSKCSWTLQYWIWKNGRPSLQPLSAHDSLLIMTSGDRPEHHVIKRHTNATEIKGLGVHMNFMGTFKLHASIMRQKSDGLARRLRQSHMSHGLSRSFYHSFCLPAVKYSLPVTSLSDADLHKIQSTMTACTLNALGYNQHYPHMVAFAPQHVFGCGLYDLRIEQGLAQLHSLLNYIGTGHKVGNVLLISLRHLQLEAGVSFDLFQLPTRPVPYLTDCWLLHLRRFCSTFNISLRILSNRIPCSSRANDSFLMEHALNMGFSRQELVDLNLARTYLQVTTVSDIASACGKHIHQLSWRCKQIPDRKPRFIFARQPGISPGQRGLWRKLMRSLLGPSSSSDTLILHLPLGSWHAESNMIWSTMVWDSNLYRRDPYNRTGDRDIEVHFPQHFFLPHGHDGSGTFYDSKPDWYSATIPRLAVPTDITGCQIFKASSHTVSFPCQDKPATSFQGWCTQLPDAEKRLLSTVSFAICDGEELLIQYLQIACTMYIGTYGTTKDHHGAFSWIISSPGKEQLVQNAGPVDGWSKCQSTLRSTTAGLASVTLYLHELANFHSLSFQCKFQLSSSSIGAINQVSAIRDLIPTRKFANNADLLSTLRAAPEVLNTYRLCQVRSPQDASTKFDLLPISEKLHVICERMATSHLQSQGVNASESTQPCSLCPRHLPVEVFLGTQNIPSNYISILRDEITVRRHRAFLGTKYNWTSDTMADIAWESFSLCGHRVRADKATARSKLVHNWLNLGVQRAKHGTARLDILRSCPYCSLPEDFVHLLSCTSSQAMQSRYAATLALKKTLNDSASDNSIFRAVKQWTLNPTVNPTVSSCAPAYQLAIDNAIQSQSAIGWPQLFRGFISVKWGLVTDLHHASSISRSGLSHPTINHLTLVIRALQDYSLAIWKSRNEALHKHSESSNAILQGQVHHEITMMYTLSATFSPIIQSYFSIPLDDRILQPLRQKQRWLRLVRLATSHASARGSRQQVMSSYFPYAPLNVTTPQATVSTGTAPPPSLSTSQQVPIQQYLTSQASTGTTTNV
jgi:hypothetical protein